MIGVPITQDRVNQVLGGLAQRLKTDFEEVATLKAWSDITPQETIEALGFNVDDAFLIKLIIQELDQLRTIYTGAANLANVKDFRVQAQKAIGLGI